MLAGLIKMLGNAKYIRPFQAEPNSDTDGHAIPLPQGRTLGGSTSINGMVHNRGECEEFTK
jgi:choline dehydrogenase